MSRNHSRRKHFKVDSIYLNLIHNNVPADVKSENSTNHNYLTLQFIGFFDKNLFDTKPIRVDIYVTGNDDSAKELVRDLRVLSFSNFVLDNDFNEHSFRFNRSWSMLIR